MPTLEEKLAQLEAENAALRASSKTMGRTANSIVLKIGDKGGLSAYVGQGKYPVTQYLNQWLTMLDGIDSVFEFIGENFNSFKLKDESTRDGLRKRFVDMKVRHEQASEAIGKVEQLEAQVHGLTAQLDEANELLASFDNDTGDTDDKEISAD